MKIILLAGPKGIGKDFVGEYMVNTYGFKRIAFADNVKKVIAKTLDLNLSEIDYLKNNEQMRVTSIETTSGLNMRTIIQRFATDAMQSVF